MLWWGIHENRVIQTQNTQDLSSSPIACPLVNSTSFATDSTLTSATIISRNTDTLVLLSSSTCSHVAFRNVWFIGSWPKHATTRHQREVIDWRRGAWQNDWLILGSPLFHKVPARGWLEIDIENGVKCDAVKNDLKSVGTINGCIVMNHIWLRWLYQRWLLVVRHDRRDMPR